VTQRRKIFITLSKTLIQIAVQHHNYNITIQITDKYETHFTPLLNKFSASSYKSTPYILST